MVTAHDGEHAPQPDRRAPTPARLRSRPVARTIAASKVYGRDDQAVVALDDVTVQIPHGRFTAIMGPSGSGKSTLMHCLAGLDSLTSGAAFIGDTELGSLSDRQLTALRRERIGFVFQSFNLVPTLTAGENVTLPFTLARRRPDTAWMDEVIATLGIGNRLQHRPAELSGGQQQRVAIARAAGHPARARLRGRTYGQPRLGCRRRGARAPAGSSSRDGSISRDGHA